MRMPRVTIGRLMVVVVFLAFGFSALARPTRLGAMILTGSILTALTISLIGAAVDRGRRRAFLVGFLIAGWSTILMCYWADLSDIFTDWWTADPMDSSVGAISNPAALLPSNGVTPTPTTPGAGRTIAGRRCTVLQLLFVLSAQIGGGSGSDGTRPNFLTPDRHHAPGLVRRDGRRVDRPVAIHEPSRP